MVIVEYWMASYLGRAWLWLQRGLRPAMADLPDLCRRVARGELLPARELWDAQDFAVKVWWRAGLVAVLLIFPVFGFGAALHPGRAGTNAGASIIAVLVGVMAVAGAQMGLLRFRANRTRFQMLRAGPGAADEPLPPGAAGLPRQADFWVTSLAAVALFAILLYAGTRSAH